MRCEVHTILSPRQIDSEYVCGDTIDDNDR